jgi:hypothetical protein
MRNFGRRSGSPSAPSALVAGSPGALAKEVVALCGVKEATMRRWEAGGKSPPSAIVLLLHLFGGQHGVIDPAGQAHPRRATVGTALARGADSRLSTSRSTSTRSRSAISSGATSRG